MKKLILLLLLFPSLVFGQATGKAIANRPSGGTISIDTITAGTLFNLKQTTASQTIVIPSLVTGAKTIQISNEGTVAVTLSPGGSLPINKTALMRWTGTQWSTTLIPGISSVAWGSITGTLSAQTDLQSALDAKQDTGSGGGGTWGTIGGTLSAQTDLQTALNAKQNSLGYTALNATNGLFTGTLSFIGNGYIDSQTSNDSISIGGLSSGKIKIGRTGKVVNFPSLTPVTVPYIDASRNFVSSAVTPTELSYLSGASSNIQTQLAAKQATLVSGTNIKTINGSSLLGSGNLSVTATSADTANLLRTPRTIYGNAFDGTANLTQIIASTYGGTGNGFAKITGPASSEKSFYYPNRNDTVTTLYGNQRLTGTKSIINNNGLYFQQLDSLGTGRGFQMTERNATGLTFPAVTLRPLTNNNPIAFDLMPRGTSPTEFVSNGWTWIDLCSADLITNPSVNCNSARMGMTSNGVVFSSKIFNSASALGMYFQIMTNSSTTATGIHINNTGKKVTIGSSGHTSQLNISETSSTTATAVQVMNNSSNYLATDGLKVGIDNAATPAAYLNNQEASRLWLGTSGLDRLSISATGGITINSTVTSAGTTGAQTIDKPSGSVNFAAATTTLVVTNALATTSSQIFVTVYGTDATATSARVTKAAGSFTITLNAAATAETNVGFLVIN